MNPEIGVLLNKYAELMEDVAVQSNKVYTGSPEIPCRNKCFDCCKQLFPITFAEAFFLSEGIKTLEREQRRERARMAEKATKKILTQNPTQFEKRGVERRMALNTHAEFARFLHGIKSDCPALDPTNPAGSCTVYQWRNVDCRTMGASFDSTSKEIIGCFRFAGLKHLIPKMMDFSYRYTEKMELDRALISSVTGGIVSQNVIYLTTMCRPLMLDYASVDWLSFFKEKNLSTQEYSVVIDV